MNDTTLLNKIGDIVEKKLEPIKRQLGSQGKQLNSHSKQLRSIREHLDTVEMKVELVNKKVDKSQEETIAALTELMNTGYNSHEKRIKKLEGHLKSSQTQ